MHVARDMSGELASVPLLTEQAAAARLTDEQNGGSDPEDRAYEDYEPMIMQQHSERLHLTFPTFDEAMDEFYSKVRRTMPDA